MFSANHANYTNNSNEGSAMRYGFAAAGTCYCALPKPMIGQKITPSTARPIPKPAPLPKLFAVSMQRIIRMMKFTKGISIRRIHHHGRPTILHQIYQQRDQQRDDRRNRTAAAGRSRVIGCFLSQQKLTWKQDVKCDEREF